MQCNAAFNPCMSLFFHGLCRQLRSCHLPFIKQLIIVMTMLLICYGWSRIADWLAQLPRSKQLGTVNSPTSAPPRQLRTRGETSSDWENRFELQYRCCVLTFRKVNNHRFQTDFRNMLICPFFISAIKLKYTLTFAVLHIRTRYVCASSRRTTLSTVTITHRYLEHARWLFSIDGYLSLP